MAKVRTSLRDHTHWWKRSTTCIHKEHSDHLGGAEPIAAVTTAGHL
jgi:hypothetical protein